MDAQRPHTKDYSPEARERLGLAVQRAREAAGHTFRPSFADKTGVGITSLVKLERGKPVGPYVYEGAARHLPNWTEDTPRDILEGGPAPAVADVRAEPAPDFKPPGAAPHEFTAAARAAMRAMPWDQVWETYAMFRLKSEDMADKWITAARQEKEAEEKAGHPTPSTTER